MGLFFMCKMNIRFFSHFLVIELHAYKHFYSQKVVTIGQLFCFLCRGSLPQPSSLPRLPTSSRTICPRFREGLESCLTPGMVLWSCVATIGNKLCSMLYSRGSSLWVPKTIKTDIRSCSKAQWPLLRMLCLVEHHRTIVAIPHLSL